MRIDRRILSKLCLVAVVLVYHAYAGQGKGWDYTQSTYPSLEKDNQNKILDYLHWTVPKGIKAREGIELGKWSFTRTHNQVENDQAVVSHDYQSILSGFIPVIRNNSTTWYLSPIFRTFDSNLGEIDVGLVAETEIANSQYIGYVFGENRWFSKLGSSESIYFHQYTFGLDIFKDYWDARVKWHQPVTMDWQDTGERSLFVRPEGKNEKDFNIGFAVLGAQATKGLETDVFFKFSSHQSSSLSMGGGGYYFYDDNNLGYFYGGKLALHFMQKTNIFGTDVRTDFTSYYQNDRLRGHQWIFGVAFSSDFNQNQHTSLNTPHIDLGQGMILRRKEIDWLDIHYRNGEQAFNKVQVVSHIDDLHEGLKKTQKPLFILAEDVTVESSVVSFDTRGNHHLWKDMTLISTFSQGDMTTFDLTGKENIGALFKKLPLENSHTTEHSGIKNLPRIELESQAWQDWRGRVDRENAEAAICSLEKAVLDSIEIVSDNMLEEAPLLVAENQVSLYDVDVKALSGPALYVKGSTHIYGGSFYTQADFFPAIYAKGGNDEPTQSDSELTITSGRNPTKIMTTGSQSDGIYISHMDLHIDANNSRDLPGTIQALGYESRGINLENANLQLNGDWRISTKNAAALRVKNGEKVSTKGRMYLHQNTSPAADAAMVVQSDSFNMDGLTQIFASRQAMFIEAIDSKVHLHDQSIIWGKGDLITTYGRSVWQAVPPAYVEVNTQEGVLFRSNGELRTQGLTLYLEDQATAYDLGDSTKLEARGNNYKIGKNSDQVQALQFHNYEGSALLEGEKFFVEDGAQAWSVLSIKDSKQITLGQHEVILASDTHKGTYYQLSGGLEQVKVKMQPEMEISKASHRITWLETDYQDLATEVFIDAQNQPWRGTVKMFANDGVVVKWQGQALPWNGFGVSQVTLGESATFIKWEGVDPLTSSLMQTKLSSGDSVLSIGAEEQFQTDLLSFRDIWSWKKDSDILPRLEVLGKYHFHSSQAKSSVVVDIQDAGQIFWRADTKIEVEGDEESNGFSISSLHHPTQVVIAPEIDGYFQVMAQNRSGAIKARDVLIQLDASKGGITSQGEKQSALSWVGGDIADQVWLTTGSYPIDLSCGGDQPAWLLENIKQNENTLIVEGNLIIKSKGVAPALEIVRGATSTDTLILHAQAELASQGGYAIKTDFPNNYFIAHQPSSIYTKGDGATGFITLPEKELNYPVSSWFLPEGRWEKTDKNIIDYQEAEKEKPGWVLQAAGKGTTALQLSHKKSGNQIP